LGVAGRGVGRLFGFIRALEEESVRTRDENGGPDEPPSDDAAKTDDEPGDRGGVA
jgi:hypothetical protein